MQTISSVPQIPLVVIVGPTASGKSALAMRATLTFGGEIICADSRTVYKGLDIGTAKPARDEQEAVPHHVIDIVEPSESFNAAMFKRAAVQAIESIRARRKLPILVGGTGLFVDAVLYDYQFGPSPDVENRATLETLNTEQLIEMHKKENIQLPVNIYNRRHLIRGLERKGVVGGRQANARSDALIVGIFPHNDVLKAKIRERAEQIFESDVEKEATKAAEMYGWEAPGLSGNIYPILRELRAGNITKQEAFEKFVQADWQLARRQMTWFRRNKDIHRFLNGEEAFVFIKAALDTAYGSK